jgi:excisionase family DNA binding protein
MANKMSAEDSKAALEAAKQKLLLGRLDVARLLSVSARTVDNMIRAKRLRCRKIGKRVLFTQADVERFTKQI